MTAPAVSWMPGNGLPTWQIGDGFAIIAGDCIDELGRHWTVAKHPGGEKGWSNPPGPRTNRDDRSDADGSFRSASFVKERLITLSGAVECFTPELRERTEIELAALCPPGASLYPYRRTTNTYDQVAMVELDDEPLIDPTTLTALAWSFRFGAPDPRKHDWHWQEPRAHPPQNSPGAGISDAAGGISDASGGISDGAQVGVEELVATVANYGTATARPFLIVRGPFSQPSFTRMETGETVRSVSEIAAGETVWINCDHFAVRGIPPQTAISSTRGNVTSEWSVAIDWPEVAAQDVAHFSIGGAGPRESVTVALRSAYR